METKGKREKEKKTIEYDAFSFCGSRDRFEGASRVGDAPRV